MNRIVILVIALGVSATVPGQGYAPEDAVARMTLADGFRAELVACEPMISQPVAMEFDDRGRLWVVQYMQYPNPEGLKRVEVDRWSRTKYDRVPKPPPHGPRGSDAITILEDANGDGRADAAKNFTEGLNLCSGVAFGHGGVFVLQAPYLLFYPDRDRDDAPDSDPEVCVTGFGMEDAHSVANSLTWGPDGWLYGNQGSTVTANIDGIEFQQGVWRYHPVTKKFELFAEGGGNMWGLDFDAAGHEFSSTNLGPYIVIHAVQGAYYWKSFGKHGALHNPFTYGYFDHVPHVNPQGGHVAVGGRIYDADTYPEMYRGKYIAANLLSHNVYFHSIRGNGSTFETEHGGTLMDSNDTWFAPSDMTLGPDGCMYVADWHDRRTAHPDPDAEWDRSNGRIYRIAYGEHRAAAIEDIRTHSNDELIDLIDHDNVWFRRRARMEIAARRGAKLAEALVERMDDAKHPLEYFWAAYASGGLGERDLREFADHEDLDLRRWAVRFLGDANEIERKTFKQFMKAAESEGDVHVRSQLASTAQRLPADQALRIASELALRDSDAGDPHVPLLIWWAVERHTMDDPMQTLKHFDTDHVWTSTIGRETVLPRLIRRFAADGSEAGDNACAAMIDDAGDDRLNTLLAGLEDGLHERGTAIGDVGQGGLFTTYAEGNAEDATDTTPQESPPISEKLQTAIDELYEAMPGDSRMIRLAMRAGNRDAYTFVVDAVRGNGNNRSELIGILGQYGEDDCVPVLIDAINANGEDVQRAAIQAVRRFSDPRIADALLDVYGDAAADTQSRVRDVMFSKPEWARAFLTAVDKGEIATDDVPIAQLRIVAHHGDEQLDALVEKHWGRITPGTPEEKLAEMRRMNNELNFAQGDIARGKVVFEETCMVCHTLFDQGNPVGPDLTQANRKDREYMLVSIVDPNFMVRKEYQQYTIETYDGEILTGIMGESEPGSVTLINANAQPVTVRQDRVESMRENPLSLMPEGLIAEMPGDDIRALFAYIQQDAPEGHD